MKYILFIPGWRPAVTNELMGHWAKAAKLKKRDREVVWKSALAERIPAARGKRHLDIHIFLEKKRGRKLDPDACLKSGLDALVQSRLLRDDSAEWCEWTAPTISTADEHRWGTRFILEDMEK